MAVGDLPSVTLSLERCAREQTGIGKQRSNERRKGALARTATFDLAHARLADDPTFDLIDAARRHLVLPHGGLVRGDGSDGSLVGADVTVTIASGGPPTSLTLVANPAPAASQVFASAVDGVLTFGAALPSTGSITITYFVGTWERDRTRLGGTLRVDVCASAAAPARALSDQVATALLGAGARAAIVRLHTIHLSALSSVAPFALTTAVTAVRRSARFEFVFEHEVDVPDSSGRVIAKIPVQSEFFPDEDDPV